VSYVIIFSCKCLQIFYIVNLFSLMFTSACNSVLKSWLLDFRNRKLHHIDTLGIAKFPYNGCLCLLQGLVLVQIQEQTLTKQATSDLFSSDDKMVQKAAGGMCYVFVYSMKWLKHNPCLSKCILQKRSSNRTVSHLIVLLEYIIFFLHKYSIC